MYHVVLDTLKDMGQVTSLKEVYRLGNNNASILIYLLTVLCLCRL